MAQLNFGGTTETVVIRDEFPLEKAREVLKNETIAVIGYGVQGPGQALNLRDNGFNVIVGQREGKTYDKAVADGWVPGETLFGIEEACERGTIVMCLLSDAAVMSVWPTIKPYLTAGKALYFSHGFAITWNDRTGVVPPADIDVIMVAPKGSGTSLRTMFLEGSWPELFLRYLSGCNRQRYGQNNRIGYRYRFRLFVRNNFHPRSYFRPDRRTWFIDGSYPGSVAGTIRSVT